MLKMDQVPVVRHKLLAGRSQRAVVGESGLRHPTTPSKQARTTVALNRWLDRAHATGIAPIQNFVGQLRGDILAVESA
jgi:hypothetical protein